MLAFCVLVGFCFAGPAQDTKTAPAPDTKTTLVAVKYDGLKQEILKHRGKVVVVDFWAITCPPCREAMPEYIKLQKEHADQGLVVITVSLDKLAKRERAAEILSEMQSPLRNYLLDEPSDVWTEKFDFKSLPFAYVFDRRGKWVRFRAYDYQANPKNYEVDVKKTIAQMLSEK
jgi:thiol-disulfide isomerase/thioredoxin